jgi:ribonucleoside-diphosphate reductase alpha chain
MTKKIAAAQVQSPKKADERERMQRKYSKPGVHPFEEIEWEKRDAIIQDSKGKTVFEQRNIEIPAFWSQTATNISASKYFRGKMNTPQREWSAKQMIGRVADTIAAWGRAGNYFIDDEEAETFHHELAYLLINQHGAFNSPVWFNVGIEKTPQCSACFIQSVEDNMGSIMDLARSEVMLFKYGSGTGSNLSNLRSSREQLAGGGYSSGPVNFMKGYDAFAGVIKSGGKTRRAAKMVILNIEHPDVVEFIECKAKEEKKAWVLINAGIDGNIDGEAYSTISYQNANHSVRVTDEFMRAVVDDKDFSTKFVTNGEKSQTFKARDMMNKISDAAWICGDPGMQYDTTINKWHTCPNTGRINASNPCSEYMHLDDSACNLASINLMKYRNADGSFDVEGYKHAIKIFITAQEILVDNSSYPTPRIEKNAKAFRELGLGYANLGALLMSLGIPYDSEEGRNYAAALTSIMTGYAYAQSANVAGRVGPFAGYEVNKEPMLNVIRMHRSASYAIDPRGVPTNVLDSSREAWDEALQNGMKHGYRNSQATVLAPTGTISFLMDCDTTGIEPELALVRYKWLVGGGMMKLVNNTVPAALRNLHYTEAQIQDILKHIDEKDTIEGAPHLKDEHLTVFDCSFKPANGTRSIPYMGHVRMMAAAQPFISGAISKTVNMPNDATAQDIAEVYISGWRMGLKAIAIYRDGCKITQPMTTTRQLNSDKALAANQVVTVQRRRLPDERRSVTHKFSVAGHEGYIHVGLYEDGTPGEIFINMAKEGSAIGGLVGSLALGVSLSLQHGVPLSTLVGKYVNMRFEPSGVTSNANIRFAKSIPDYIFRWMAYKFLTPQELEEVGLAVTEDVDPTTQTTLPISTETVITQKTLPVETPMQGVNDKKQAFAFQAQSDAPACSACGAIMVRNAACYKCVNCGGTSGCS